MNWDFDGGILNIKFAPIFTVALAAMFFILGEWLRSKIELLRRFCVPAGVVGGFCMALLAVFLYYPGVATVSFDNSLQITLIAIFLTRIGLTGSFQMIRQGGRSLFTYLCFGLGLTVMQNLIGVATAMLLGMSPVLGVMAGAVALEGGHNWAVIFGPMAERLGVAGAQVTAIASATFGLLVGGTLGAPVANWLIKRYNVKVDASHNLLYKGYHESDDDSGIDLHNFIRTLGLILMIIAIGRNLALWLQHKAQIEWGWRYLAFPGYLGAMISMLLAVLFRNVNDAMKLVRLQSSSMNLISTASVSIFLTVSMMNLRIWELYSLALPLMVILLVQVAAILFITVTFLFPLMGRDYDAAIICAGFIGHGLGSATSAVSMMRAACEHHKLASYKAFLIVPVCGAVLIDLIAFPGLIWLLQYLAAM